MARFMTDRQLCEHFGLSERALGRLRALPHFPKKDNLISKTDAKLVDQFFDQRARIASPMQNDFLAVDGKESFDDD